jgi:hypothetical protein
LVSGRTSVRRNQAARRRTPKKRNEKRRFEQQSNEGRKEEFLEKDMRSKFGQLMPVKTEMG